MTDDDLHARQREYICRHNPSVRAHTATERNRAAWAEFFALSLDGEALCSDVQRSDATRPRRQPSKKDQEVDRVAVSVDALGVAT